MASSLQEKFLKKVFGFIQVLKATLQIFWNKWLRYKNVYCMNHRRASVDDLIFSLD